MESLELHSDKFWSRSDGRKPRKFMFICFFLAEQEKSCHPSNRGAGTQDTDFNKEFTKAFFLNFLETSLNKGSIDSLSLPKLFEPTRTLDSAVEP